MREQYMRNGEGFLLVFSVTDRARFVMAFNQSTLLVSLFFNNFKLVNQYSSYLCSFQEIQTTFHPQILRVKDRCVL